MRSSLGKSPLSHLSGAAINAADIDILLSPRDFHSRLLSLIASAKRRIYLTALYVQDDEAGREVLKALYQALQSNPQLDIRIFVDFHRAQRGLIGETNSLGNRALYQQLAKEAAAISDNEIRYHGVPVKRREVFGVLHLKGFVFDDTVLYSGASINDVYLHHGERYRYDRYYQLVSPVLADSMASFLLDSFVHSGCAPQLEKPERFSKKQAKKLARRLGKQLKLSTYWLTDANKSSSLRATPILGFGKRGNKLNNVIRQLVRSANKSVVLITPYFNLPKPLRTDLTRTLKSGVKVDIVVGDKTANDFYLPPSEPFSTIGIVPYLYELLLVKFVKKYQGYIDSGMLNIHLWKHDNHSFHLKGVVADETHHLITGSNLNPRAWSLDLENGILLSDPEQQIAAKWQQEYKQILSHTQRLSGLEGLENIKDYPPEPQALLKKIKMTQIDRVLKRFL